MLFYDDRSTIASFTTTHANSDDPFSLRLSGVLSSAFKDEENPMASAAKRGARAWWCSHDGSDEVKNPEQSLNVNCEGFGDLQKGGEEEDLYQVDLVNVKSGNVGEHSKRRHDQSISGEEDADSSGEGDAEEEEGDGGLDNEEDDEDEKHDDGAEEGEETMLFAMSELVTSAAAQNQWQHHNQHQHLWSSALPAANTPSGAQPSARLSVTAATTSINHIP